MAIRAAVLGASGFAGGELLRLLGSHPAIEVVAAGAASQQGKAVTEVFPALGSFSEMRFCSLQEALGTEAEILFCSLPHGHSSRLLPGARARAVIDLAGDFRLQDPALYAEWYGEIHPAEDSLADWVYGATEIHRSEIAALNAGPEEEPKSKKVANPGCYAAASILALAPLIKAGAIEASEIHIGAMSGVSGAGRAQGQNFDFVSVNENARAYKPVGHNHIGEIEQELSILAGEVAKVSFIPHLVPMSRGILVSVSARSKDVAGDRMTQILKSQYDGEPFVRVMEFPALPETRRLSGTNFAEVAATFDARTGKVFAFAAIDNLGKGAAGQAIQNANLMLGLDETTGLLSQGLVP